MNDNNEIVRDIAPGVELVVPMNGRLSYNISDREIKARDFYVRVRLTEEENEPFAGRAIRDHAKEFAMNYVQSFVNYFSSVDVRCVHDAMKKPLVNDIVDLYREFVIIPSDGPNSAECMAEFEKRATRRILDEIKSTLYIELRKKIKYDEPELEKDVAKTLGLRSLSASAKACDIDLFALTEQYLEHASNEKVDKGRLLDLLRAKFSNI